MIEAIRVRHSYENKPVLQGVQLKIRPGEPCTLIGANGSGKTTLLKILAGLFRPQEGEVLWEGKSILDSPILYRSRIGFLGHENYLYPDLTVEQNLRFYGGLYRVPQIDGRVGKWLEQMGLVAVSKIPVRELSHGTKKKVSLIRAILHEPEILFFDEPFSGLDDRGRGFLRDVLKGAREAGRTVLVTLPEGELPREMADDRLLELSTGQVVEHELA